MNGYKGIDRDKRNTRHPWRARIMRNGLKIYIGSFTTAEEAQRAYDATALELFGE